MKLTNNIKTIAAVFALTLGLSACSKRVDQAPIDLSGFAIIHASPTEEKLDLYVESSKANLSDFAFGNKIDYLNALSGTRKIMVTKKGSATPLKTKDIELKPQVGYSFFIINKLEEIDFLNLEDNLSVPANGKAKVRFINLSPDAGELDLYLNNATEAMSSNKAYKAYSDFIEVDASKVSFKIKTHQSDEEEALLQDVELEAGKIYTVWVKGLKANTDELKLSLSVFTHK